MHAPVRFLFPALLLSSLVIVLVTRFVSAGIIFPADAEIIAPVIEVRSEIKLEEGQEDDQGDCELSQQFSADIRQWCSLITASSREAGLDPNLVASVIQVESAGNPNAYSGSGAVGLMQVMPRDGLAGTFQCINGPCFASRPSMDELFAPAFNISYGTGYLSGLINKNQNLRDGLFAYGPAGVGYSYADHVLQVYRFAAAP